MALPGEFLHLFKQIVCRDCQPQPKVALTLAVR